MSKSRVTIVHVAEKAGVSTQTVSRVINNKREISEETRQHVLEVIHELGYRPNRVARSLVTSQTFSIGLVIPDIANPFFSEITRGAEDVAWENGYNVLLCNTVEKEEREKKTLHLLEDTRVDGVIVCSSRMDQEEFFPMLANFRSAVLVNRHAPKSVAGVVRVDDFEGGRSAVQHLLQVGKRRIGFLAGPEKSFSGCERIRGGLEALDLAGVPWTPAWRVYCPPKRQAGYDVARQLLSDYPEIDALVCHNDLMAVGALQACLDLNRPVPQEVALVGFDDITLSRVVCPPLTTLSVSKVAIGASAARLLLDRLQGRSEADEIIFKPQLLIRGSTLPLPV